MATRIELATEKVFERMKAVYLHEVARIKTESRPDYQTLSREYDIVIDSEDPTALQQWIAQRGEDAFHRVLSQRVQQARRRRA